MCVSFQNLSLFAEMPEASCPEEIQHRSITGITHRMTPVVGEKVSQYARYLFEAVGTNWSVVYEDGDMKVYRRELEEGGVVVDPLKSFYTAIVRTGHEWKCETYIVFIYIYMAIQVNI